jgi:hypothetical protein
MFNPRHALALLPDLPAHFLVELKSAVPVEPDDGHPSSNQNTIAGSGTTYELSTTTRTKLTSMLPPKPNRSRLACHHSRRSQALAPLKAKNIP